MTKHSLSWVNYPALSPEGKQLNEGLENFTINEIGKTHLVKMIQEKLQRLKFIDTQTREETVQHTCKKLHRTIKGK